MNVTDTSVKDEAALAERRAKSPRSMAPKKRKPVQQSLDEPYLAWNVEKNRKCRGLKVGFCGTRVGWSIRVFYPRELTSVSVAHSERSRPCHRAGLTRLEVGRRGSRKTSEPPGPRWPPAWAIRNTSPRTHDQAKISRFQSDRPRSDAIMRQLSYLEVR